MERLDTQVCDWLMSSSMASDPVFLPEIPNDFVLATTRGRVHNYNQDRVLLARFSPESGAAGFLFSALCDGLGGGPEGDRCAAIALAKVLDVLVSAVSDKTEQALAQGISVANDRIHDYYDGRGGTTFTGLCYTTAGDTVGLHVGDSRAYSFNPASGQLAQLTTDHNLAAVAGPAQSFPQLAAQLTQCLGMGPGLKPEAMNLSEVAPGHLLQCSDGLYDIGTDAIGGILCDYSDLGERAEKLINCSRQLGGHDNASLLLLRNPFTILSAARLGELELMSPGRPVLRIPTGDLK